MSLNSPGNGSLRSSSSDIPLRTLSPGGYTATSRNRLSTGSRSPQPDVDSREYQHDLSSTTDRLTLHGGTSPAMPGQSRASFFQKGKKKSRLSDADNGRALESGEEEERLLSGSDGHIDGRESEHAFSIPKEVGATEPKTVRRTLTCLPRLSLCRLASLATKHPSWAKIDLVQFLYVSDPTVEARYPPAYNQTPQKLPRLKASKTPFLQTRCETKSTPS
jgi:hypothetical protein